MEDRRHRLGGALVLAAPVALLAAALGAVGAVLLLPPDRPLLVAVGALAAAVTAVLAVWLTVPSSAVWTSDQQVLLCRPIGARRLPAAAVRAVRRRAVAGGLSVLVLHAGPRRHHLWVTGQHGTGLIWQLRKANIRLDVRGALLPPTAATGRARPVQEVRPLVVRPTAYPYG